MQMTQFDKHAFYNFIKRKEKKGKNWHGCINSRESFGISKQIVGWSADLDPGNFSE